MKPEVVHVHERPLSLVKFNYDGDFFITCAKDGDVCLMRTDPCERVGTYPPPGGGEKGPAIAAVDITLDSQYVVVANVDGKLLYYKFTGEMVGNVNHQGILKYVEWNQKPGAQNMVCTCNDKFKLAAEGLVPHRIMVWQFQPSKRLLVISEELPMKATKVKWGPFDETLVSIHEEGTIVIWDSSDGKKLKLLDAHKGPVTNLNFTEDRMLMISSSKDHTAKVWAMDEYECVQVCETDRPLNDASISPLYNAEKDPKYHILMGGGQDAKDVTTTATGNNQFGAVLWHMIYNEEIGTIRAHFGPLNTLAWRRDGRGFVTGGEDGFVRVHVFDNEYFTSKKFE